MGALRHVDPNRRRGPIYRTYANLSASAPASWVSRLVGWRLDPILMRWSGGRIGVGLMLPTALLATRGARTGTVRHNVVIYFHDGDDAERTRLWLLADCVFPPYARYRERAAMSGRAIPILRLTPASD